jgi:hypothetical protein
MNSFPKPFSRARMRIMLFSFVLFFSTYHIIPRMLIGLFKIFIFAYSLFSFPCLFLSRYPDASSRPLACYMAHLLNSLQKYIPRFLTHVWTAGSTQLCEYWSSRFLVTVSCDMYWYSVTLPKDHFFCLVTYALVWEVAKIWRPFMPLRPQSYFSFIIKLGELWEFGLLDGVLMILPETCTEWCVRGEYATRDPPEAESVCTCAALTYKAISQRHFTYYGTLRINPLKTKFF